MRARLVTATCTAAISLSLSLTGCFGSFDLGDAIDTAHDIATEATELADALSHVDWGKIAHLTVRDATTGDVVAQIEDQATIEDAFAALSGATHLISTPDAQQEYVFELWQPETVKLNQTEPASEVQVLEVVTYQDSDDLTLTVTPIGLSLSFTSADCAAALRALVPPR